MKTKKLLCASCFVFFAISLTGTFFYFAKVQFFQPDYRLSFGLFLALLIFLLLSFLSRLRPKKIPDLFILLFGVLFSLVLIFNVSVRPAQDSQDDIDMAAYLAQGNMATNENHHAHIFKIWPNNHFFTAIIVQISKVLFARGVNDVDDYLICLEIINAGFVWTAIYLTYLTIKESSGARVASSVLILLTLNPLIYFSIFYIYTITFCLPFLAGTIYFYIKYHKTNQLKYILLMSLSAAIGYKIRAVAVFPLIAICVIQIASLPSSAIGHTRKLLTIKKYIPSINVFLMNKKSKHRSILITAALSVTFVFGISACTAFAQRYFAIYDGNSYPISFWLALGSNARLDGVHDIELREAADKYSTQEARSQFFAEVVKDNYQTNGVWGTLTLVARKIQTSFGEPTDFVRKKSIFINQQSSGLIGEYFAGDKSGLIRLIAHIYHFLMTIFVLYGILRMLNKRSIPSSNNLSEDLENIVLLTLLGGFIFYAFWESSPDYCLPFIPLEIILAEMGIAEFYNRSPKDKKTLDSVKYRQNLEDKRQAIRPCSILYVMICLIVSCVTIRELNKEQQNQVLLRSRDTRMEEYPISANVLTQDFEVTAPFNRVTVYGVKSSETTQASAKFLIKIYEHNARQPLGTSYIELDEGAESLTAQFPKDITSASNKYTLELSQIEPNISTQDREIMLKTNGTYYLMPYGGTLTIDNIPIENRKIFFTVSHDANGDKYSINEYVVFFMLYAMLCTIGYISLVSFDSKSFTNILSDYP